MKQGILLVSVIVGALVLGMVSISGAKPQPGDTKGAMGELRLLPEVLSEVKAPTINQPQWLIDKQAAAARPVQSQSATQPASTKTFTYSIQAWGKVAVDKGEFGRQAAATLSDNRGWLRAGARFSEVASGGDFILVISEASELARRYAPGCSAEYSCRVGPYVIINQDRWVGATPSWNNAGGNLRDYRHMVINHEIGHWLGHGHAGCSSPGQPAPVMLQQSIDLQGCDFNPWPLQNELWVGR